MCIKKNGKPVSDCEGCGNSVCIDCSSASVVVCGLANKDRAEEASHNEVSQAFNKPEVLLPVDDGLLLCDACGLEFQTIEAVEDPESDALICPECALRDGLI